MYLFIFAWITSINALNLEVCVCCLLKILISYIPCLIEKGSTAVTVHIFCSWRFVFVQTVRCPLWWLCCEMGSILLICIRYRMIALIPFLFYTSTIIQIKKFMMECILNLIAALFTIGKLVYGILFPSYVVKQFGDCSYTC